MTRRRRRLPIGLVVLALLGVLALPGVHWRLIGWWRGEPFYQGRPASYYAACLRTHFGIPGPAEAWVRAHAGDSVADVYWHRSDPLRDADAAAVPVLR